MQGTSIAPDGVRLVVPEFDWNVVGQHETLDACNEAAHFRSIWYTGQPFPIDSKNPYACLSLISYRYVRNNPHYPYRLLAGIHTVRYGKEVLQGKWDSLSFVDLSSYRTYYECNLVAASIELPEKPSNVYLNDEHICFDSLCTSECGR